ncbi:unnamed protein product, partial [Larinioides sclopetarius]
MIYNIGKCILNLFYTFALAFCPVPEPHHLWKDQQIHLSMQQAQKRQVKPTATQPTATRARKAAPKSSRARAMSSTRVWDVSSCPVLVRSQSLRL